MLRSLAKLTLLSAGTSAAAGSSFSVERSKGWTFCIESSGVTSGATVAIEAYIGDVWRTVDSRTITATGNTLIRDDYGHYEKIRASITAYTDGSYDVFATGSVEGL